MFQRLSTFAAVFFATALAVPAFAAGAPAAKADAAAGRLLLPFYLVESDPAGTTTLFAVRNESDQDVEVTIDYFQVDRPQTSQHTETLTLTPKRVRTFNLRDLLDDLLVDDDGFARGAVVIEADMPVIQGDYFQLTGAQDFATADRLVNVDPTSVHNELCQFFTLRFLSGSVFNAGTLFTVWLDLDAPPDPVEQSISYTVYDEAGTELFSGLVPTDRSSFTVSSEALLTLQQPNFGAIEFDLGVPGHVSAVMSAEGRYSVGLKGLCRDL